MIRLLLLLLPAVLFGCSQLPIDYSGSDAGHVIIGIGGVSDMRVTAYHFRFRRISDRAPPPDSQSYGVFSFTPGLSQRTDYKTPTESGVVVAATLPPGQYELYSYEVSIGTALGFTYFRPKEPFSIPFTVLSGQTAYLGNYQANRVDGTNMLGQRVMAFPYFQISDRSESEHAIARASKSTLPALAINATPRSAIGPSLQLAR